jgi:hypothetical protein
MLKDCVKNISLAILQRDDLTFAGEFNTFVRNSLGQKNKLTISFGI